MSHFQKLIVPEAPEALFFPFFPLPETSESLTFQKTPVPEAPERVIFKKPSFRRFRDLCFSHFFTFRRFRKDKLFKMTLTGVSGGTVFPATLLPEAPEPLFFPI